MTTLFINEQEVTVPVGTSIIEACRENGVDVPHFCYHPELSVAANCRMCLVEVEGWNKPAASCCTPVAEGMKVSTQTESLDQDRKMMMEYLLLHHPLDCPVCDEGGACRLQDYAVDYGADQSRNVDGKRAVVSKELGPFITTCMTRCIHCTRCVRFADEVAGTGEMGVLNRGDHMTISAIVDECLDSELSGNLANICPVGSLLDGPSHDKVRPWELTRHKSTCTQCPQGCDISIESRGDEVIRIQPVEGGVEPWLCDRGRYVFDAFRSDSRILQPRIREAGALVQVSWDEAIQQASRLLKGKRVGMLISPDWSIEGFTAIRLLHDGAFDQAMISYDLHRRDMRSFAFDEGLAQTTQQIEDADEVVVLGSDLRQRLPLLMQRLRKRLRAGKTVTRIGSMNYRTNAEPTQDVLIRPSDWYGVIARAMEQVKSLGKSAAGMDAWLEAVDARHEAGKFLADALLADQCSILVGEEIRSHGDAAALIHGLDLLMRGCGHAEAARDGRNLIPEGMNAQALAAVFADVRCSAADVFAAAERGELDTIFLIGSDPVGDGLFPVQARQALKKVSLLQVGAIEGEISQYADVLLPAAAYAEIEGSFVGMEGRVRVAEQPLKTLGEERPLWKVMMRLLQGMGHAVPAINLQQLRAHAVQLLPELAPFWQQEQNDKILLPVKRDAKAVYVPKVAANTGLDVVSRYSMFREGMWARASDLLSDAGRRQALDDVLVHPQTLVDAGLQAGQIRVESVLGEGVYTIGTRDDVSPGVLFVAKRGIGGDLSSVTQVKLGGMAS